MSVQQDAKPISPETISLTVPSYEIRSKHNIPIDASKDVAKFIERKNLLTGSYEYERNGSDPGLVLIFNQEWFESDREPRLGTRRDVNEIISCMSRLGFNINDHHIYNNLTRHRILDVIDKLVQLDLSEVNSLIVFFLTHGGDFNALHASDATVHANELWGKFAECESLKNKPKMFIFQACKGYDHSSVHDDAPSDLIIDLIPDYTFNTNYIGPDMLIVYSTTEGNVSFRDSRTGSWFIQELCKNFTSYGRRDDVVALIIRTTKCICRNYYYIKEGHTLQKQIPIFISTLRKKFYLNRSKDRNILIQLVNDQEKIKSDIEDLQKKVAELLKDKEKR